MNLQDESFKFIKERKVDGLLAIMLFYGKIISPIFALMSVFFLFDYFQHVVNLFAKTDIVLSTTYKINIMGITALLMFVNSYFNVYLRNRLFNSTVRQYKWFLLLSPFVLSIMDMYLFLMVFNLKLNPEILAAFIVWYFFFFLRINLISYIYFSVSKQVKDVYIKLKGNNLDNETAETEIPTELNRVVHIKEDDVALSPIKKRIRKDFDSQIKGLMQKGYNLEDIYDAFLTDEEKYIMSLNIFSQVCGELYFGAPRN